ncbi:helix-turn-helix domain-containing protein [Streptomyces umbrinus]
MGVLRRDARLLSLEAQEDLRRRAVAAVQAGHSQADVATVLGVSAKTVWRVGWMRYAVTVPGR